MDVIRRRYRSNEWKRRDKAARFPQTCRRFAGDGRAGRLQPGVRRATAPSPHGYPIDPSATVPPTAPPTVEATVIPLPTERPYGQVSLVKTEDRAAGIQQAIDLLEVNPVKGKSLFVKPNLNSADPFPGSTHPGALLALAAQLEAMGAGQLTVGDRSGMGNTGAVMRAIGIDQMAKELGWRTLNFDELSAEDWQLVQPEASHWANGFALPRPVLQAEGLVQTCCLKTHRYGGHFTLSLKNSVGLAAKRVPGQAYNYMSELHNSPHQRRMIAEINLAYQPDLVLMDAMEAFVDGGPARGTKVAPGVVLASRDRVALDAVGVAILRYFGTTRAVTQGSIFEQDQIARAIDLGLGAASPTDIELITADQASAEFARPIRELLFS